jgi:hypothetical protein
MERLNMSDTLRLAIAVAMRHMATDGPAVWASLTAAEPNGEPS